MYFIKELWTDDTEEPKVCKSFELRVKLDNNSKVRQSTGIAVWITD